MFAKCSDLVICNTIFTIVFIYSTRKILFVLVKIKKVKILKPNLPNPLSHCESFNTIRVKHQGIIITVYNGQW